MSHLDRLAPYLKPEAELAEVNGVPTTEILDADETMKANAFYFGQKAWMQGWLDHVHRYPEFRERWLAVAGSWDGMLVVDIGCGPGNLLKSLGGQPELLIGVDIAPGSLEMAASIGYVPLLADAHALPLKSQCADLVVMNATLHHCVHMDRVLIEAARIVRPGGMLVIDHDPQLSAWNYRGVGMLMWNLRKPLYRWMNRGGHRAEGDEQQWAERTEIHHRPGAGVTDALLRETLEGAGFTVVIYPHNHAVGAGVLKGEMGRSRAKLRWGQRLSGIDPDSRAGALSLMCAAVRTVPETNVA